MNCREFENNILALARGELIADAARTRCLSHSEGCVRCAARLEEERTLLAGIRAVAAEAGELEAPPRVQAPLLTAFRQQFTATPPASPRRFLTGLRVAAVAAGILLLISGVIFWQRLSPREREHEARKGSSAPPGRPDAEVRLPTPTPVARGRDVAHQAAPRRPQRRARRQTFGGASDDVEEVTQFFTLREGEDLMPLDSVRLIRVELPGSALNEVGLPIPPETASARVKADVVLGPDGSPLAIRFVR